MYLARRGRTLGVICIVFAVLMVAIAALGIVASSGRDREAGLAMGIVLLIIAGLFMIPGGIYLRYRFSDAARLAPQRDLLLHVLKIAEVAELKGLQWALIPFPDRVTSPSYAVLAVFLQNAHGAPRSVELRIENRGGPVKASLGPGECGLVRLPFMVGSGEEGTLPVKIAMTVTMPSGVGVRVIERDGVPRPAPFYRAFFDVAAGAGPTRNPDARAWADYRRIWAPGQPTPDLDAIRLLETLV